MVKKRAPIAIDAVTALEQKRIVDRSDRKVKPGSGPREYDDISQAEDNKTVPPATKPSSEVKVSLDDAAAPLENESLKPVPNQFDKPTEPEKREGDDDTKIPEETVQATTEEIVKTSEETVQTKEETVPKVKKQVKEKKKVHKESNKPHALSVPLRVQEYAMYNEIIEKVNALGFQKKIAGTDIQRASIHLLYKMTPERILKAYMQSLMTVGAPDDKGERVALSVLLHPRERKMFLKIIDKINALKLSKKIKGTDVQRASIYILHKMQPEKIIKAHFQSLMP